MKPRAESVGTRNPLVELAILDGGRLHTGPWPSPVGELLTRGPQVFAGYVDKKQTEEAFRDGWLRTGDICRIDADGFVYIMGRAKDVIIRGGHNIDPRAIEDAVAFASQPGGRSSRQLRGRGADAIRRHSRAYRSAGPRRLRAGQHPGGRRHRVVSVTGNAGHACGKYSARCARSPPQRRELLALEGRPVTERRRHHRPVTRLYLSERASDKAETFERLQKFPIKVNYATNSFILLNNTTAPRRNLPLARRSRFAVDGLTNHLIPK